MFFCLFEKYEGWGGVGDKRRIELLYLFINFDEAMDWGLG